MSVIWLVVASLVWTGLIAAAAEMLTGKTARPHFAQSVWRGAAALMILPWIAAAICAVWPAATGVPLPSVDVIPGAAGSTVAAFGEADTALKASAAPWLLRGILAMLVIGWGVRAVSMLRAQIRLQRLKASAEPGEGRDAAARWAGRLGLRNIPEVKTIERGSPFVAGIKSEAIYLPACITDVETRALVIAHECVHVSRKDLILRPFERLVADLLWFSPFAWHTRGRLDYYREAVCDLETVKLTGARTEYARALTSVARAVRPVVALPVSSFVLRRKTALPQRVKGIVDTDAAPPKRMLVTMAVLAALIATPFAVAQGIALEARASQTEFTHPVVTHTKAKISAKFGWGEWNNENKMHEGIDISAPKGAKVYSPAAGKVVHVTTQEEAKKYGHSVSIYLEGEQKMRFTTLDKVFVKKGDKLSAGDPIGTVGKSAKDTTGPHVHVELWKIIDGGRDHEAVDPEEAGVQMCPDSKNKV